MKRTALYLIVLLFFLTGCVSSKTPVAPTPIPPTATPTEVKPLPTPAVPGNLVTWGDFHVIMDSAELTDIFVTEFGTQRLPPAGQQFLWVHVRFENTGKNELDLPAADHFSVLYADSEFKSTYGHRQGYADYTALSTPLFPGQSVDAWLRFDIPNTAQLSDLWFVFLPESAKVGASPSAADYPWGGEHPVFAWLCR